MSLQGTGLSDKNVKLRFLIFIGFGVVALGSVLYWRSQLMVSSEYVDFPNAVSSRQKQDNTKLRSQNFEIETFETSPTVK